MGATGCVPCWNSGSSQSSKQYLGKVSVADYILASNVHRRHLTDTQRAAIGVEVLHWQEAQQAKERQAHRGLVGNQTKSVESLTKSPTDPNRQKTSAKIAEKMR